MVPHMGSVCRSPPLPPPPLPPSLFPFSPLPRLGVVSDYALSTHSCIVPSNGQSPLVYHAAIVEIPDQAPCTT